MSQRTGGGKLRIIGGHWRGRKLPIAELPGLRPTGDRIRETLFNWLSQDISAVRCLDLFAGTGALGLEALSRGASHCDFVEHQKEAATLLQKALLTLGAENRGTVFSTSFDSFLQQPQSARPYDLVFLDPPFQRGLVPLAIKALEDADALAPGALIYIEHETSFAPDHPANWHSRKHKQTKTVVFSLYEVDGG